MAYGTETPASCRDFWNNRLSSQPSSGGGRDTLTLSRSSSLSLWVFRPRASCSSAHRRLTEARTACLRLAQRHRFWRLLRMRCGRAGCCNRRTGGGSNCLPRQVMWDRLSLLLCSRELQGHVTSCVAEEASLGCRSLEELNFVGVPMSTRHSQRWRSWTTSEIARPRDRAITYVARGTRSGAVRRSFRTSKPWTPPCMSFSAFSLKNLQ